MNTLTKYFLKGLLFLTPIIVTLYVLYLIVSAVDRVSGVTIPGIGFLILEDLFAEAEILAAERLQQRMVRFVHLDAHFLVPGMAPVGGPDQFLELRPIVVAADGMVVGDDTAAFGDIFQQALPQQLFDRVDIGAMLCELAHVRFGRGRIAHIRTHGKYDRRYRRRDDRHRCHISGWDRF